MISQLAYPVQKDIVRFNTSTFQSNIMLRTEKKIKVENKNEVQPLIWTMTVMIGTLSLKDDADGNFITSAQEFCTKTKASSSVHLVDRWKRSCMER